MTTHPQHAINALLAARAAVQRLQQAAPGNELHDTLRDACNGLDDVLSDLHWAAGRWDDAVMQMERDDAADLRRRVAREMADA